MPADGEPLAPPRIAASTYLYEEVLLRDLGFDVTFVEDFTTLDPAAYDVLAVSAGPSTGYPAQDTTFVYDPLWFPVVGPDVRVDERYGEGDFFCAGHWIDQEAAAGQPSIVSGVGAQGGRAVLFGTDPLFRQHPKKLFGQVAQALTWTSIALAE